MSDVINMNYVNIMKKLSKKCSDHVKEVMKIMKILNGSNE